MSHRFGKGIGGYSLIELSVVLVVAITLGVLAAPLLTGPLRDREFGVFAAELTGQLLLARSHALHMREEVHFDFQSDREFRYRLLRRRPGGGWRALSLNTWPFGYGRTIHAALPAWPLPHPHTGSPIRHPISSTHGQRFFFGAEGSSSGSVVFSDGRDRVLCAVISGETGRFRVYLWNRSEGDWDVYY